ncbi:hypothetical protein SAMN04488057_11984 [Cyclobacterium lianum]|uniref:Nodulation protein Z (NodZ) n=1 Tax=Cyclobacterium lianum TaxID=388280 RepID=A0A1M7QKX6_9BACT|nr:hypothetical protein [Cyclobacterium lianum]SHN31844.1 hypothetical protein SAMN04488057_11984 [Cyclobacterium lianum]
MPKRSAVSPERLQELKKENACYVITCYKNEFLCRDHPNGRCERGFFSLFLQVLYGMAFAKKYNLPYRVDFANVRYAYSGNQDSNGSNFWEELMVQRGPSSGFVPIVNLRYETHPLRIWDRQFIRSLHHTIQSELRIQDKLLEKVNGIKEWFSGFKILGLHARRTDHATEVPPVSEWTIMNKIEKKIADFDRLFVATDDEAFLEMLKARFPQKVLAHDFIRSASQKAIHDHGGNLNGILLGEQALLDCLSLSFCQELILSPSNLSYAALLFQPETPYTLAESNEAAWSRRKTLLAYRLNQWGIRKW